MSVLQEMEAPSHALAPLPPPVPWGRGGSRDVGEALKLALRALGSPRLVYENVVRANGKFTTTARMDLLESSSSHARIAYVDVTGTPFHPLDCQYNQRATPSTR